MDFLNVVDIEEIIEKIERHKDITEEQHDVPNFFLYFFDYNYSNFDYILINYELFYQTIFNQVKYYNIEDMEILHVLETLDYAPDQLIAVHD